LKNSSEKNKAEEKLGDEWYLQYRGFEPSEEGLREALCTLSNGYFGTRGAANEASDSRVCYPGTYIAGVYNKLGTKIAGKMIYNEDLVNCPNWLPVDFRLKGGDWVSLEGTEILSHNQCLDLYRGILSRETLYSDNRGIKVKVSTERFAHMRYPHIGALSYTIEPQDYEGPLYIRSILDGNVRNNGVARYSNLRSQHLKSERTGSTSDGDIYLSVRTSQSDIRIAQASGITVLRDGKKITPEEVKTGKKVRTVFHKIKINAKKGCSYRLDKVVAMYTSRDEGVSDPLREARKAVAKAPRYNVLRRRHISEWKKIWEEKGFRIRGRGPVQKILNFHAFHLLQTATEHNRHIDAALPARGLHGESYRGHIFWDEMFVMPLYDYQNPVVSRALLLYRYERIDQARKYAAENGYRGAMFPWQSGATGEEETQVLHLNPMSGKWGPDYSRNQRHISFAIAYNIWKFWQRTGDRKFMKDVGYEMFLSIASFCSSLCEYSDETGRYHTHGLMGPDEFHEKMPLAEEAGYTDNAYSNIFIVWILERADLLARQLPASRKRTLMQRCGIGEEAPERWADITRKMNLIINDDDIIAQFDGYFDLKELNWEHYKKKYGNIHRMDRILKAEGRSPNSFKVAKQADVLMMFYVFAPDEIAAIFDRLGYRFRRSLIRKNYDYYIERTSHGSTLSKVVHCYLAHIMGRKKESWKWYLDVLDSDIHDVQGGTTPEGIHTGVMGGSIDILMRGFAGIESRRGSLRIAPDLPAAVKEIAFRFSYRGAELEISVGKGHFTLEMLKSPGEELSVYVYDRKYKLEPGKVRKFSIKK
jgi:trehalose/maltose hydrolase-like predicted phosphorylase